MGINNQEILDQLYRSLKSGDMTAYRSYYSSFKGDFITFAHRYTQDREVILDVYHDAFIILYENILSRKLVELQSSLKTYVFSIGKYSLINRLKKDSKLADFHDNVQDDQLALTHVSEFDNEENEDVIAVRKHLSKLGAKCRELLKLFYYKRYSIEAIVHEMGYKNENTVKAHKSRCIKSLRQNLQVQTQESNQEKKDNHEPE